VVSVVPSAFDTTSTYAVARFYSAAAARQAVQELSGVVLRGKKMKVCMTLLLFYDTTLTRSFNFVHAISYLALYY
jgi:hypothetical protein